MLRLNRQNLTPATPIISAAEFQTVLEADAIIKDAEEKAAEILKNAETDYEVQKKKGYDDGQFEASMEVSEKMMETIASSVDYFASLESKVADLVCKSVRRVLGDVPQPDRVTSVVRNALAVARNETRVTVRVSPADVEVVKGRVDEIMRPYPSIHFVDVVPDSRLEQDGCILETEIGVVDASVNVQLAAIESSLKKKIRSE